MKERNTKQKEYVLTAMMNDCDHPTAEQVYGAVRKYCPNIGLGTVYRILKQAAENGKIRKISVPDGCDRFDVTTKNHYHLCCEGCGKFTDIAVEYDEELNERAKALCGSEVRDHDIVFYWTCPECVKDSDKA